MDNSVLATKLIRPPARPNWVLRPRLLRLLDQGIELGCRLTLVSAPAGYGKTTLICQWIEHLGMPCGWLTVDRGDNDPARFLSYLISAFERFDDALCAGLRALLQAPQTLAAGPILTPLVNRVVALDRAVVLVLDDLHVLHARPVLDALSFLVEHLPPTLHLVLASRADPALPLARLRGAGEINELRQADLRFAAEEAREFLGQAVGSGVSGEHARALGERTEGWITGLQLAAISMRNRTDRSAFVRAFAGSNRHVLDYLVEEVLQQQSEQMQSFLLRTCMLDQLAGPLCDAVIGDAGDLPGYQMLELLERDNVFLLSLDDRRVWYRYHRLFADLLRQRLRQAHPDLVPELHRRASAWYERAGQLEPAVDHALAGEEYGRAARLVETQLAEMMWRRGRQATLLEWFEALPPEFRFGRPQLEIYYALMLMASGQVADAEKRIDAAQDAIDVLADDPKGGGSSCENLRGMAATVCAGLALHRGNPADAAKLAKSALPLLAKGEAMWRTMAAISLGDSYGYYGDAESAAAAYEQAADEIRDAGNPYLAMAIDLRVAALLRTRAQLRDVVSMCRQALSQMAAEGLAETAVAGRWEILLGDVLREWNDLRQAEQHVRRGLEIGDRERSVALMAYAKLALIRIQRAKGDTAAAMASLNEMGDLARQAFLPQLFADSLQVWRAAMSIAQGEPGISASEPATRDSDLVQRFLQAEADDGHASIAYLREIGYIWLGRLLLLTCPAGEAAERLDELCRRAAKSGRTTWLVSALAQRSRAFYALGDQEAAMTSLKAALSVAEPGGFVRAFLDEGPEMARLLYKTVGRGIAPRYVGELLASFPEPRECKRAGQSPGLIEPLSEREREVLGLIAEGLANREIAARVVLTLNTIKSHTRSIYGKLGVSSRTQAVAKGRALGLLPDS